MERFRGCCHNSDCDGFENCDDCWNDYKANHKMTNADRIRAMSDDELAEWLEQIDCYNCDCCIYQHDCRFEYGDFEREHYDCKKGRMEWLKRPVKEDA